MAWGQNIKTNKDKDRTVKNVANSKKYVAITKKISKLKIAKTNINRSIYVNSEIFNIKNIIKEVLN